MQKLNNVIIQQNNPAVVTLQFLQDSNIHIHLNPPGLSDLSPIEHIWDVMRKNLIVYCYYPYKHIYKHFVS